MGDAWTQTERTARVEHRCELCEESILPGWRYVDGRGCGDDGWYRWPMHVGCERLLCSAWTWEGWPRDARTVVMLASWLVDPDIDGIPPGVFRVADRGIEDVPVLAVVYGVCAAVDAVAGAYR